MKALLTGKNGQVGWELVRALAPLGEVVATGREELDLADLDALRDAVQALRPDVIVNAAAYTAVDKAESEPELAMRINGEAPGVLAEQAKRLGALLVHYSTDYVFDGEKVEPYTEEDAPNPISAYGKSKLAGERAILASRCRHLILRTSWVYSNRGKNFYLTILKAAREGRELRVVSDQFGAPTSAAEIASATTAILGKRGLEGLFHMTAAGRTSWHGFAEAIVAGAGLHARVAAIPSADYPAAARRPRNSQLDNGKLRRTHGVRLQDWRTGLSDTLAELG